MPHHVKAAFATIGCIQPSVHLNEALGSSSFMKIINVLGDEHIITDLVIDPEVLKFSEGQVCSIW